MQFAVPELKRLECHMFRRVFANGNGGKTNGAVNQGPNHQTLVAVQKKGEGGRTNGSANGQRQAPALADDFEQVYMNAGVKAAQTYSILKVAEMVISSHLSGMSLEARRCALLMALEAAGAESESLLQDAVVRQRALNDYEQARQQELQAFETSKMEENRGIQEELDRVTSLHMGRMQTNLDEVARAQDNFRAWQRRKQLEGQRISDAAAYCVPQGCMATGGLSAVLERASAASPALR
jgi:hypothetical protein